MFVPLRDRPRRPQHAPAHDRYPIAERQKLGQIAADYQDGLAFAGVRLDSNYFVDQGVDLRLARDVDAARRLVEDEYVDIVMQQAGERDLLLVTARQLDDRLTGTARANAKTIYPSAHRAILPRRQHHDAGSEPLEPRQRKVVANAEAEREPLAAAIFAEHAHALAPAAGGCGRPFVDSKPHASALDILEAEQRSQQRRPAGADEPGDPEHLAAVECQAGGARAERVHFEDRFSSLPRRARIEILDVASDHHADDLLRRKISRCTGSRDASIPQHDNAIGDFLHFLDEVRDVDDRVTLFPEAADQIEQPSRIVARQRARGLVEHEHTASDRERTGDLDELLLGDRQGFHRRVDGDVRVTELGERVRRSLARALPVDDPEAGWFDAKDDVLATDRCGASESSW